MRVTCSKPNRFTVRSWRPNRIMRPHCTCWVSMALQVGKYEAAIELISAAVGIDPRQAQFHAHLADAYGNLGQWSEAVESYRRAIGIAPDFFAAHDSLGKMFRMQNNLVEAEAKPP